MCILIFVCTYTVMEVIHVLPVGSSSGYVLLLVNSILLCKIFFDHEFNRLAIGACIMVEPTLQVSECGITCLYIVYMVLPLSIECGNCSLL